jgi:hypothetical protein
MATAGGHFDDRRLEDIRFMLGEIKSDIKNLTKRAEEDRSERDKEHIENQRTIEDLTDTLAQRARQWDSYQFKTDNRIATLETLGPVVAGLQLTKEKLTMLASIGFVVMVSLGWVLESAVKWIVNWALSHFAAS